MVKTNNQYLKTIDGKVRGETVDGVHTDNYYLKEISENIGTGGDGSSVDLSKYVKKSDTTGLLKNDGTVDTTTYLSEHQSLSGYVEKSDTTGLLKNDGTVDTSTYLTQHQDITGKEDTTNKVTSLSASSTDTQYPSAKAVYDTFQALPSTDVIEITSNKGTASASTMGKFYIEVGNNKRDVYYTEEDNGSYSWCKLDTDVLDDLSIDWSDIENKPDLSSKVDSSDLDSVEVTVTYTDDSTDTFNLAIWSND